MREPPYGPGDRGGVELLGLVGTVARCAEFGPPWRRGWVVRVVWDGLPPRMLVHHGPEELALAGA